MLDKMREGSQGVAAKVILVVIILSFALAGVGGYLGSTGSNAAVIVNGEEISSQSVDQAYQTERARLQQQFGEQFDIVASNPNFAGQVRAQATQTLISERLVLQAISEMGLRVGDDQVKNEIRNMPEFQVEGKFNNDQYLALLRRNSYTPAQFSAGLKQDLARRQLLQMLVGSEFVLPAEVEVVNQLQAQKRIAKVLNIKTADFMTAAEVSEEELQAYYQANSQQFQFAEQVSLDYVVLDASQLSTDVEVTTEEIQAYYDQRQADYQRAERRKVAHILISDANKADAILAELKAGADFATVAAEKSEDSFSAKNQGELDWFEAGVWEESFNDASFALTNDAPLSDVVKTQFGYHIIKLVDVEESQALPLSDVELQVKAAIVKEKNNEVYYELHQRLSEVAFESPDSLDEAAGVVDGEVQHSELFNAQNAPFNLSDKAVLQLAFDQNFREEGNNSDLIELSDTKAIVVRVNEYKPAKTKPLTEVAKQITERLKAEKAQSSAKLFVADLTAKLDNNEAVEADLSSKSLAFSEDTTFARYDRNNDFKVIEKVFKLAKPADSAVSRGWVETSNGDFAIVEVSKVLDLDAAAEKVGVKQQIQTMLERSTSEAIYQALVAQLMAEAEIQYVTAN